MKFSYDFYGISIYDALGVEATASYFSTKSNSGSKNVDGYLIRTDAIYPLFPNEKLIPVFVFGLGDLMVDRGAGSQHNPLMNAGLGLKYFLEEYLALRTDVRYLATYRKNEGARSNYELTVGLSYLFGKEHKKKPVPVKTPAPQAIPDLDESAAPPPPAAELGPGIWEKLGAAGAGVLGITMEPPEFLPEPLVTQRGNALAFIPYEAGPAGEPAAASKPVPAAKAAGAVAAPPAAVPAVELPPEAKPTGTVTPPAPVPAAVPAVTAAPVPAAGPVPVPAAGPARVPAAKAAAPAPAAKQIPAAQAARPAPAGAPAGAAVPAAAAAAATPGGQPAQAEPAPVPAPPAVLPQGGNQQAAPHKAVRRVVIRFGFAKSDLNPADKKMLAGAAGAIKAASNYSVFIEGHTDSVGSYKYNLALSKLRARAVRNELTKLGISPEKIATRGYGPAKPVATNLEEQGRRKNRRAVVVITIVTY